MYDYDYGRHTADRQLFVTTAAPTGRRRNAMIATTAAVLLTAGLALAAVTADSADATPVSNPPGTTEAPMLNAY